MIDRARAQLVCSQSATSFSASTERLAPIWETLAEHFEEFADTLTM